MTEKKFIKGLFITEYEGKYGDFLSFGITDEGIEQLKSLPKNEKGIRNFAAFRQKNDNRKYSPMWPKNAPSSSRGQENDTPPPPGEKDIMPF